MKTPWIIEPFKYAVGEVLPVARGNAIHLADFGRTVMHAWASIAQTALEHPFNPAPKALIKPMAGTMRFAQLVTGKFSQQEFNLHALGEEVGPCPDHCIELVDHQPFGDLKHFAHDDGIARPPILVVAAMSGHFASLVEPTLHRLMDEYDVYVTDWADAHDVPLSAGGFDLDTYTSYVMKWTSIINQRHQDSTVAGTQRRTHVMATCQPGVPVATAAALMSEDNHPDTPISITLMGSPLDTRQDPRMINKIAGHIPFWLLENSVISTVPAGYAGAGRKVYDARLQIAGFVMMNLKSHLKKLGGVWAGLAGFGDDDVMKTVLFYEEYFRHCTPTAEFYLQTIKEVFQHQHLANGEKIYRDPDTGTVRPVDLSQIRHMGIMTVEGGKDEYIGTRQTHGLHELTPDVPAEMRKEFIAEGVGHYGLFGGSKWRTNAEEVIDFTRGIDVRFGNLYGLPRTPKLLQSNDLELVA